MLAKAASVIGVMPASAPPAIIASSIAAPDDLRSLANGMGAGGAGRDGGKVVATRAHQHRDVRARKIRWHHRDEKRIEAVGWALEDLMKTLLQCPEATTTRADNDADLVGNRRDI